MEITQLRYFKAVAETGKIVSAANAMFVTPPTVSVAISRLENELGVSLFIRKNHRLYLSRQGNIFLEYVNRILLLLDRAAIDLAESSFEDEKHISVAVGCSYIWAEVITEFAGRYPEYPISTTTLSGPSVASGLFTDRYSFLLGSEGEFAFRMEEGLKSTLLFEDRLAVLVYKGHRFEHRESVRPEELSGEKIVWARINQFYFKKMLEIFNKIPGTVPVTDISISSQLICRSMVEQGTCIALTTTHSVQKDNDRLVCIPLDVPDGSWEVRMFQRADRKMSPEEETFGKFLVEYYTGCAR